MTRDRDTPRPGRVPRHLLSRARARVCQAQGHLPSPSFPAAASAQCASYCCLETILGVDAGHYSERSEDGAHINFTLLAAGRVMEGGGMTGHQRSSTSVVPDQFSQWSNTFSHRAACRLQTAAVQHCTQLGNLIAISVSTGAVSGARGLLLLLL